MTALLIQPRKRGVIGGLTAGAARVASVGRAGVAGIGDRGAGIAISAINDLILHDDRSGLGRRRVGLGRYPRAVSAPAAAHRPAADRENRCEENQHRNHQTFSHYFVSRRKNFASTLRPLFRTVRLPSAVRLLPANRGGSLFFILSDQKISRSSNRRNEEILSQRNLTLEMAKCKKPRYIF